MGFAEPNKGSLRKETYCYKCLEETQQIRCDSKWLCKTCWSENDGTHPVERSNRIHSEPARKGKPKPFKKSLHRESQWSTLARGRSVKARLFKRSRFTAT